MQIKMKGSSSLQAPQCRIEQHSDVPELTFQCALFQNWKLFHMRHAR